MVHGYKYFCGNGKSESFIPSDLRNPTDHASLQCASTFPQRTVEKVASRFSFSKSLKSRIENQERTDRLVFAHFTIDGLDCDDRTSNRINKVLSKHTVNNSRKILIPVYRRKKEKVGYCQN